MTSNNWGRVRTRLESAKLEAREAVSSLSAPKLREMMRANMAVSKDDLLLRLALQKVVDESDPQSLYHRARLEMKFAAVSGMPTPFKPEGGDR